MERELYTISIYTENNIGLLTRISTVFLKRHYNIESLNVSATEIDNVHRFTIVTFINSQEATKLICQLEKQIEVIKAYYHKEDEVIYHETSLFKIKSELLFEEKEIQNIIKHSNSRIVTVNKEFFVLEKTGRDHEIKDLYDKLSTYGIMQFVQSGRVSISKSEMEINKLLNEYK